MATPKCRKPAPSPLQSPTSHAIITSSDIDPCCTFEFGEGFSLKVSVAYALLGGSLCLTMWRFRWCGLRSIPILSVFLFRRGEVSLWTSAWLLVALVRVPHVGSFHAWCTLIGRSCAETRHFMCWYDSSHVLVIVCDEVSCSSPLTTVSSMWNV